MGAALRAQATEDGLSSRNFEALSRYIYDYSGIKMPITKLTMLEGRLRRRLRATGITSFNDYCDYLFKHGGIEKEAIFLIDAVTTNKTDFFREPEHFKFLAKVVDGLPAGSSLRVWSAASSSGEEGYSIAMLLAERLGLARWEVLGTDLSTAMVEQARSTSG